MSAIMLRAGLEPFPGYRLCELRGRGGYAEVWEAETNDGRRVALKFLSGAESSSSPREIRAIEVVRKLVHPNLAPIDQIWIDKGYIVISMELADASLLDLLVAHKDEYGTPIPPDNVCHFLAGIASALDFLNTRQHHVDGMLVGIRHCDVKPSNMLLVGDTVKLTDFGLSSTATSKLQPHRRAGTLDYAAPEVFQGRISEFTDQYALGISYCLLRCGKLPFHDTPKKFDRKYQRALPDLSMMPAAERPIVGRSLASVPHERWPTCTDFIAALAKVAK